MFRIKPLHVVPLVMAISFPLQNAAKTCSPPPAFDHNITYATTRFVSPVGNDQSGQGTEHAPYRTLNRAVKDVQPGTDIVLEAGTYPGGALLTKIRGTSANPIRIRSRSGQRPAIFEGGTTGVHLVEPAYLVLQGFVVQNAGGNGINIDDGGSYESPAHHVILRNLTVQHIGPSGNKDGIKLSGLDQFRVENCTIRHPGDGGSAIDMVGCHDGLLVGNHIQDCQNTGIQAKGGSARLLLYANRFENGGARAVNMGGSTGMQFFRPLHATAEASYITVWANVFVGSQTPIAFVGCEKGLFAHNTIYKPEKWIARILQENNHPRLIQCRNNVFANNIVVLDDRIQTFVNIGPNTHPGTFIFDNNLWYHTTRDNFSGPQLPRSEPTSLIQRNPLFANISRYDFHIPANSPATGAGGNLESIMGSLDIPLPSLGDFDQRCWHIPPSIGAFEGHPASGLINWNSME